MNNNNIKNFDDDGDYPRILGLDHKLFQLSNRRPLTNECQEQALKQLENYLKEQEKYFLGYQLIKKNRLFKKTFISTRCSYK